MIIDTALEFFTRNVRVRGRVRLVRALKPLLSESSVYQVKVDSRISFKMRLHAWDNTPAFYLRFFGFWEQDETKYLINHVRQGDTFFDIGANVGYFTLLGGALVGKEGAVHSFEPVPETFRRLEENVQLNPGYRPILNPVALSDRCENRRIYLHPQDSGSNSFGAYLGSHATISVSAETLDTYVTAHRLSRVAWIKLDVEGAETVVIRGGKNVLQGRDAPSLLLEVNPERLRAMGSSDVELQTLLHDLGYELYFLETGRKVPIQPAKKLDRVVTVIAEKPSIISTSPMRIPTHR